jgi:SAM-dependent methyltransferase
MFTSYLKENGHEVFAYPQDALDCKVAVDIVTSFDVIEHLEDPNSFVDAAYELLRPGGKFILSMPNVDDVLLKVCHEKFAPFFFQAAHLNYFGSAAVDFLFSKSQFSKYKIDYIHKYDLTNLMHWLKNGNPGNWTGDNCFDRVSTAHVKADFERLGIASHLFVTGEKI